jgi:hypothetical protein
MNFYRYKKSLGLLRQRTKPDADWQARQKEVLLAEIRLSPVWRVPVAPEMGSFFWPFISFFRGTTAAILVVVVIFSGFITTVSASRASLPGDVFYSVKISLEKAQIGLDFSEETKAELEMAFAGTRLNEVNELIKREAGNPESSAHIKEAMGHFSDGMSALQKRLATVKTVSLSTLINDTTLVLEDNLLAIKGKTGGTSLDQALATVDKTNTNSLAMIVATAITSLDNDTKQEALAKLQTKVQRIEKKIDKLKAAVAASETVAGQEPAILPNDQSVLASSVSSLLLKSSDQGASTSREVLRQIVNSSQSLEDAKKILEQKDPSKLDDVLSIIKDAGDKINEILK